MKRKGHDVRSDRDHLASSHGGRRRTPRRAPPARRRREASEANLPRACAPVLPKPGASASESTTGSSAGQLGRDQEGRLVKLGGGGVYHPGRPVKRAPPKADPFASALVPFRLR